MASFNDVHGHMSASLHCYYYTNEARLDFGNSGSLLRSVNNDAVMSWLRLNKKCVGIFQ